MAKQSSVNLDITNNADGFDISGGTVLRKLSITGGDITVAGSGSATLTFPTTTTTIAGIGITQSFTVLQTFNAGLSASGATFSGNIFAPNIVNSWNGLTGAVTFAVPLASASVTGVASFTNDFTVSAVGAVSITSNNVTTVNGKTGNIGLPLASASVTGIASFGNEFVVSAVGAVGLTSNYVKSVNGLTGAIVSVAVTGSNTFTGLQTMNAGLSAAGGVTFSGNFSGATGTFSKLLSASAGVLTDSVVPLAGLGGGGTLYINADANGNGGAAVTYIGDWLADNNGTNLIVDDLNGVITLNSQTVTLNGAIDTTSTAYFGSTVTVASGGAVLEWDGFAPTPTVLSILNTDISQNTLTLNAQGTFSSLNTNGTLQYGAAGAYSDAFSITTAITGATTVASFTKTQYRSFEFDVQGARGTTGPYQFTKILAVHDGTTVTTTQLSNISTGGTAGTYTVDISGTLVRLRVTPGATASTVFKTVVKAILV
jgi:hypothetical protein